jgi:non-specific protein-tyrosine kinase
MELRDIYSPLIRWWRLILAATFIAALVSGITSYQQPPIYSSKATLIIGSYIQDPNPDFYQFYSGQQLATTYADIAQRKIVRDGVKAALGLEWLPSYRAEPIPNTQFLEIVVIDTLPARAQAVANALAEQIILQSPTNRAADQKRQEFINERLDVLETKIQETQAEIDDRQEELSNLNSARQIADMQNQIASLQAKMDTLQYNYTNLLASTQQGAINSLSLVEPASLPEEPIGPNRLLTVLTASSIAFILAVGAAYLLTYLDNSIKSPEEIKRLSNLPTLGAIPLIPGDNNPDKLVVTREPRSPISEAYRTLRTGVQFSMIDRPESTSVQVTSANPSEGKSVTAANLAAVIAQAGHRVLIMDADLRRPMVHKIFGIDNRIGLTDFFRTLRSSDFNQQVDILLDQLARPSLQEGLWVLTSGPIPPNPSELLGSNTFQVLIKSLKERFDYLILDSPPVMVVTDAVVLSTLVNGSILVVDAETTQKNQLKQAAERLKEVNANILGVVVNRISAKTDGFQSYYVYSQYRKYGTGPYGYAESEPSKSSKVKFHWNPFKNRNKDPRDLPESR